MTTTAQSTPVIRIPGEFGPILRCSGKLISATLQPLRRELDLLVPLGHPVFTVNLTECRCLDSDAVMTLYHSFKRLRAEGRRMAVVAGDGPAAQFLQEVGFDWVVPTFASEEAAALALRGESPVDVPDSWAEARADTLLHWRLLLEALDHATTEVALRRLTSITPLCEYSDLLLRLEAMGSEGSALSPLTHVPPIPGAGPPSAGISKRWFGRFRRHSSARPSSSRCSFCPYFAALGGDPADLGCRSVLDPIIAAVQAENREEARAQVRAVIDALEAMPLPQDQPGGTEPAA